ncbi:MAG: hypothetical protein HY042_09275 [Spirochaetia bacterium]|nr:hypothetical protein [Spirochaetia bacterium]
MKTLPTAILLLILLGPLVSCDSAAHNEDKEKSQTMILAVTRATDVRGYCVLSESASYACGNTAGLYASTAVYATSAVQPTYSVTVPAPQGINEICSVLPNAAVFAKYSDGAKICQFQCGQAYWEQKKAAGLCTGASYVSLVNGFIVS